MAKYDELLLRVLRGTAGANIPFDDLRHLLRRLGFEERIRGGHHIFRTAGIMEKPNLQREGNEAKVYQVCQVRASTVWEAKRDVALRDHPLLEHRR